MRVIKFTKTCSLTSPTSYAHPTLAFPWTGQSDWALKCAMLEDMLDVVDMDNKREPGRVELKVRALGAREVVTRREPGGVELKVRALGAREVV